MTRGAICVFATLVAAGSIGVAGQADTKHASAELLTLADQFRQFRSPLFRPRTWRPTHEVAGVPDYAAVSASQLEGIGGVPGPPGAR